MLTFLSSSSHLVDVCVQISDVLRASFLHVHRFCSCVSPLCSQIIENAVAKIFRANPPQKELRTGGSFGYDGDGGVMCSMAFLEWVSG